MYKLSESEREALKNPLGKIYKDIEAIIPKIKGKKIISVGDICTLMLLNHGITPYLAVFDYKYMRKELPKEEQRQLENAFPKIRRYRNSAGTISKKIMKNSARLLKQGGAVFIEGEDDLIAITLIMEATKDMALIYGQPKEGIVLVEINEKTKNKLKTIISYFYSY